MKRRILISMMTMVALLLSMSARASGLVPEDCTIGEHPVYYPIGYIGFSFDGAISVAEGTLASIYCDEEVMATALITANNEVGSKRTQGKAEISFETPLILPKGKTYKLVIPANTIYKSDAPTISNDQLTVEFSVPATLGDADPSIEDDTTLEKEQFIGFYFKTEIAPIDSSEAILLRNGIPVRICPLTVSWDWDLGYAGVDFGEQISFEDGVGYTLRLPQGAVSALHRPDITNNEAEVSFVGSSKKAEKSLDYVWCSLYDHHPTDVIDSVLFYYDQPIILSGKPAIQLIMDDSIVVKEVAPTLTSQNGMWILAADFESTPLSPARSYSVVIQEGTVVTPDGDVVVNSSNATKVDTSTGLQRADTTPIHMTTRGRSIELSGLSLGTAVGLFKADGSIVASRKAKTGPLLIHAPEPGVYIIKVGSTAQKILVR